MTIIRTKGKADIITDVLPEKHEKARGTRCLLNIGLDLFANSEDLDIEIVDMVNENFWDLI